MGSQLNLNEDALIQLLVSKASFLQLNDVYYIAKNIQLLYRWLEYSDYYYRRFFPFDSITHQTDLAKENRDPIYGVVCVNTGSRKDNHALVIIRGPI